MLGRHQYKEKELMLISRLRKNARMTLTDLSQLTQVPISTVHDKLKHQQVIRKHTCILDFSKLGFSTVATILLKVKKDHKEEVAAYLKDDFHVNSLHKINAGYDFLVEGVFRNIKELEDFIDQLEDKHKIRSKQVFYIIDELAREQFMDRPESVGRLV